MNCLVVDTAELTAQVEIIAAARAERAEEFAKWNRLASVSEIVDKIFDYAMVADNNSVILAADHEERPDPHICMSLLLIK